jgi:tetratricopeptide (TPR) repeat protein
MRYVLAILNVALFCLPVLMAQEKGPAERPYDLSLTAAGRQHHPIQTRSREAQDYFDQGFTLLSGFNHEEAVRAFRRAAALDPASPMPLWGIAMAMGPNYNLDVDATREKQAFDTIQKARQLAAAAPANEKDYVSALAARYSGEAHPDYRKLSLDYSEAMRGLSQKYPDDLDAATLYAESLMDLNPWKLWSLDGQPWERTEEIVRVLESVLARDPHHLGANHLYIHAMEASPHPERALPSAKRLETMAPSLGHLVHMPAHIYIRTGNYEGAAKSNEDGVRADEAYLGQSGTYGSNYDFLYYCHNLQFLAAAASMEGRYAEAKRSADELEAHVRPMVRKMPPAEFYLPTANFVLLRFHRWDEILKAQSPEPDLVMASALWHFVRGVAAAEKGQTALAEAERKALEATRSATPADAEFGMYFNKARAFLDLAANILDSRLAMARGDSDLAIQHLREAVRIQDGLNYGEPPEWFYPVRETLAAKLLASGKAEEAEQVFREDLRRNPRNPRSLFGLLEALKTQKRNVDAAWVEREFKEAWKNADTELKLSDL